MIYFYGIPDLFEDSTLYKQTSDYSLLTKSLPKSLALDLETTGLNFMVDKIVVIGISNGKDSFVFDFRVNPDEIIKNLKPILEDPDIEILGANIKFDYKFLKKVGIRLNTVYDVILSERVLLNGKVSLQKSLDAITERRLHVNLDKSLTLSFTLIESRPLSTKQILYCAEDVSGLHRIKELQLEDAKKVNLGNTIKLENFCTLGFGDMEYHGMKLNIEKWLEIYKKNIVIVDQLHNKLDDIALSDAVFESKVPKYIQGDLFSQSRRLNINLDSPIQCLRFFNCIIPELTTVNSEVLEEYSIVHPIIDVYLEYKEFKKLSTTYGKDFLKHVEADGCVHTDINQIVNTGRISSRTPNLQNLPASNEYRNCFDSFIDGYLYVSSDYQSQELAIIAYASKDPVWIRALKHGDDLHSVCADLVFKSKWKDVAQEDCAYYREVYENDVLTIAKQKCKCPKHKELRDNVKTINFGLAYGMSAKKFASKIKSNVPHAQSIIDLYFTTFPNIKAYLESSAKFGKFNGYITTLPPWNRRRLFPEWFRGITYSQQHKGTVGQIERQSKNTPIQGAGADMVKYAIGQIRKELHLKQYPAYLVCTVHDQIDTVAESSFAEEWKEKLTEIMEKSALLTIPEGYLKASTDITPFWAK